MNDGVESAFASYEKDVNQTPIGLIAFDAVYVALTFLIIPVFLTMRRRQLLKQKLLLAQSAAAAFHANENHNHEQNDAEAQEHAATKDELQQEMVEICHDAADHSNRHGELVHTSSTNKTATNTTTSTTESLNHSSQHKEEKKHQNMTLKDGDFINEPNGFENGENVRNKYASASELTPEPKLTSSSSNLSPFQEAAEQNEHRQNQPEDITPPDFSEGNLSEGIAFTTEAKNDAINMNSSSNYPGLPNDFNRKPPTALSNVPSAATTSRLQTQSTSSSRRRKKGKNGSSSTSFSRVKQLGSQIGQQDACRRTVLRTSVQAEAHRLGASAASQNGAAAGGGALQASASEEASVISRYSRPGGSIRAGSQIRQRGMSDAASSVLEGEIVQGEAEYYRQKYVARSMRRSSNSSSNRQQQIQQHRGRAMSISSDRSHMPPLPPDVISPEDAADANDPGRNPHMHHINDPRHYQQGQLPFGQRHWPLEQRIARASDQLWNQSFCSLDFAEPDFETRRIIRLAFPSVAGAVADPLLRLILIGIISHSLGTDSMVAFIFVILCIRTTTGEIAGAIIDTETILVQDALAEGDEESFVAAGQHMLRALVMQLVLCVPLLLVWVFSIEDVVNWLLRDTGPEIASIAHSYTQVIIIEYIVRVASRVFMLPFRLSGPPPFEVAIEVLGTIVTVVGIIVILVLEENAEESPTLTAIAWIQVAVAIVKTFLKVAIVAVKGWFQPYSAGFFRFRSLLDTNAAVSFLRTLSPLFLGSLVELREWDLLTFFVRHVGPPEVATWVLMGTVWEVFEASTTGLGEAGAVRISYYLSENLAVAAKKISHKVFFLATIQSLAFFSLFLLVGPNIAVGLTTDPTLGDLFNNMIGMTALANASMTFAQIYWSLVGAQGRFGLASSIILFCRWFVVFPFALVCIYAFFLSIDSVIGAIAVGYATAALILVRIIIWSDWDKIAHQIHEEMAHTEDDISSEEGIEEEFDEAAENEDEDDDSDDSDESPIV